ncbi:MAG: hypothetical protein FWG57_02080 [Endomicrobia bacterium]|nr:hypothetical protein [Endomicrobiia bacterium]
MKIKFFAAIIAGLLLFPNLAWAQKKAVNPDSAEDVAELKADAEKGDRGAQYELSMVYTYKQDAENALKWLTKSAESGYGRAQYTLGNLYYTGSGKVKRDYEKAIQWFEASKETKYKGAKVDELIASAKQKIKDEKKSLEAKKKSAADATKEAAQKAAAEAVKKAKETEEAAQRAAAEAAAKAKAATEKAIEASLKAVDKSAEKLVQASEIVAKKSKNIFHKIK